MRTLNLYVKLYNSLHLNISNSELFLFLKNDYINKTNMKQIPINPQIIGRILLKIK